MERLDPTMGELPPGSWPGGSSSPNTAALEPGRSADRRRPRKRLDAGRPDAAPDAPAPEAATHEGAKELPMAGGVGLNPTVGHPLPSANDPNALPQARTEAADALLSAVREVAAQKPSRYRDQLRRMDALLAVAEGGGRGRANGDAALLSRVTVTVDGQGRPTVTVDQAAITHGPPPPTVENVD